MVDINEIVDMANVKEFIAIAAGIVGSDFVRDFASKVNVDPKIRDAGIALGALGVTYFLNDYARKNPDKAELLGLAGLFTTTVGAVPVANHLRIQVAKHTGQPVVVQTPVKVSRGVDVGPTLMKKKPVEGVAIGR